MLQSTCKHARATSFIAAQQVGTAPCPAAVQHRSCWLRPVQMVPQPHIRPQGSTLSACLQGLTRSISSNRLRAHPHARADSLLIAHLRVCRGPNRASWSSRPGADAGALEQNVARLFRDKVKFSLHVEFTQASILAGELHAGSGFSACVHFCCSCKAAGLWCLLPVPSERLLVSWLIACMPPAFESCCCFVTQTLQAMSAAGTHT